MPRTKYLQVTAETDKFVLAKGFSDGLLILREIYLIRIQVLAAAHYCHGGFQLANLEMFFDRGTLVLEAPSEAERAKRLPTFPSFLRWDARVGCWRAPAYRFRAFSEWLGERDVPWVFRIR